MRKILIDLAPFWITLLRVIVGLFIIVHQVDGFFLWPRMVPYYYPLPPQSSSSASSSSSSSPQTSTSDLANGAIHTRPHYQYDWNQYNARFPHSSVLFPGGPASTSADDPNPAFGPSFIRPPSPGLMQRLLQKPWLGWKFSKFALRPSASSPCLSSSSSSSPSSSSSMAFPTLSSLTGSMNPSLGSSGTSAPCGALVPSPGTSNCCSSSASSSPPPWTVQTNVNGPLPPAFFFDRHRPSSSVLYPSSNYLYSPSANFAAESSPKDLAEESDHHSSSITPPTLSSYYTSDLDFARSSSELASNTDFDSS